MKINYIVEQMIFNYENDKDFEIIINASDVMEYQEDEKIEIKFCIKENSFIVTTEKTNLLFKQSLEDNWKNTIINNPLKTLRIVELTLSYMLSRVEFNINKEIFFPENDYVDVKNTINKIDKDKEVSMECYNMDLNFKKEKNHLLAYDWESEKIYNLGRFNQSYEDFIMSASIMYAYSKNDKLEQEATSISKKILNTLSTINNLAYTNRIFSEKELKTIKKKNNTVTFTNDDIVSAKLFYETLGNLGEVSEERFQEEVQKLKEIITKKYKNRKFVFSEIKEG